MIRSNDGTQLYSKINEVYDSKANIIIVHGVAEHLEGYDQLTTFLNENSFNVIRYDQRGHGRSEGKSVFYSRVDEIVEDLDAIIQYTKATYSGKTLFNWS